jgi:hypothetical protein
MWYYTAIYSVIILIFLSFCAVAYQLFIPSLAICIAMFAFTCVGDGLRDALDLKKGPG